MKAGAKAWTSGFPATGSFPSVKPEQVRLKEAAGDGWWVVQFCDGGLVRMHESRLVADEGGAPAEPVFLSNRVNL